MFDELAKRWFDAAELCEWALDEPRVRIDKLLSTALAVAGEYLKDGGRMREQRGSPYVLPRSSGARGDNEVRGRTRWLALQMHKLFGAFFYGTVATIVTVALRAKIDEEKVRDWCHDLEVGTR
jgi:hypothetical protein